MTLSDLRAYLSIALPANGGCDRGFHCPSEASNSMLDGDRLQSVLPGPLRNSLSFAAHFVEHIPVRVVGLIDVGRPSAIAGAVVPVIVDSIEAQPIRTNTHVSKEHFKPTPLRRHRNASTAVAVELFVGRARASVKHRAPRVVSGGARHQVLAIALADEAAARLCVSAAELLAVSDLYAAASTSASPKMTAPRDHGQLSVNAASEIYKGGHIAQFTGQGAMP